MRPSIPLRRLTICFESPTCRNRIEDSPEIGEWERRKGFHRVTPLDPKQVVSFKEHLMSQGIPIEVLTRFPVENRILTMEEFLNIVRVIDKEMKARKRSY